MLVNKLIDFCIGRKIKLIVIDPLVGFHDVIENDNTGMERVATVLRRVAVAGGEAPGAEQGDDRVAGWMACPVQWVTG